MNAIMKPTKTEYKRIIFDSKSEAVFARCLDMAGHGWVYHPAEHCGHEWDFLVFRRPYIKPGRKKIVSVGGVSYFNPLTFHEHVRKPLLIEYKPSMPTDTYVENLTEKMRVDPCESIIVWGNPWSGPPEFGDSIRLCSYVCYPVFSTESHYGWGDFNRGGDCGQSELWSSQHHIIDILGISEQLVQEAKSFRFDLAH